MVEALLKFAIIVVILVVIYVLATWALGTVGIVIPQIVITAFIAILVLVGCLWLWRNRGSLGL
jgi:hypothetical protein